MDTSCSYDVLLPVLLAHHQTICQVACTWYAWQCIDVTPPHSSVVCLSALCGTCLSSPACLSRFLLYFFLFGTTCARRRFCIIAFATGFTLVMRSAIVKSPILITISAGRGSRSLSQQQTPAPLRQAFILLQTYSPVACQEMQYAVLTSSPKAYGFPQVKASLYPMALPVI